MEWPVARRLTQGTRTHEELDASKSRVSQSVVPVQEGFLRRRQVVILLHDLRNGCTEFTDGHCMALEVHCRWVALPLPSAMLPLTTGALGYWSGVSKASAHGQIASSTERYVHWRALVVAFDSRNSQPSLTDRNAFLFVGLNEGTCAEEAHRNRWDVECWKLDGSKLSVDVFEGPRDLAVSFNRHPFLVDPIYLDWTVR